MIPSEERATSVEADGGVLGDAPYDAALPPLGLTFDDVLLLPGETDVIPSEVDTTTRLTRDLSIRVPLLSSAMDTVTESRMAIAMARQGGIGILHRNLSIEDQAYQVDLVKRTQTGIVNKPVTIGPKATLEELDERCGQYRVSGLPVVDEDRRLLGMITNRDLRFVSVTEWATTLVADVMTPLPLITAPVGISREDATAILRQHKRERLPLVDAEGRWPAHHRQGLRPVRAVPARLQGRRRRLLVGAADRLLRRLVGARDDAGRGRRRRPVPGRRQRPRPAHARHDRRLKRTRPPGTSGARRQRRHPGRRAGAGRRGRGRREGGRRPGSICTTRVVAGVGVPQVTAIFEAAQACRPAGVPLVGDGGLQYSGDIAKALVAGADTVMVGGLLAGCDESPGSLVFVGGKQYKTYRGMGSIGAMASRGKRSYSKDRYFQADVPSDEMIVPEGIEGQVPYRGRCSGGPPARRRAAPVDVLPRRAHRARAAPARPVRPHHRRGAQGEPPARHPDDRRGAELREPVMADVEIGIGKSGRRAYGFDEIAIVPSRRTRDPEDVSLAWEIDAYRFELPLVASAMDGVVSPTTAIEIGRLGGLAVLNLEGLWTRYDDPEPLLDEIAALPPESATQRMQEIYSEPIEADLITARVKQIRDAGVTVAASLTPQRTVQFAQTVLDSGVDLFVIQGTVVSAEHVSSRSEPLNLKRFIADLDVPVLVGGCATYMSRCTSCAPARRASSSASGPGRPTPRAACSGSACRWPPPSPTPPARGATTSTSRRAATSTSSPTAACAPAATSRRRSPAAPTPS
jgi:IMP dehydrogenase